MSINDIGDRDPVVIVGMSVEAPGGVSGPGAYWQALVSGRSLMEPLPRDRGWDLDGLFALPRTHGWGPVPDSGGFLHGATEFDPGFFGISPKEVPALDSQQRVAMRVAWAALEQAGVDPTKLRDENLLRTNEGTGPQRVGSACLGRLGGVFMGASPTGYGAPVDRPDVEISGHRITGVVTASVAGRISHMLGLAGPSIAIDAACASSVAAVNQAVNALLLDQCEWALAGGVCVMGSAGPYVEFSRDRALDPSGYCRPYSANAAGTVWGEGAAVLVLERRSRAEELGHRVLAEILGVGVNHNGAGAPITVPSQQAQEELYRAVLARAKVSPFQVTMLEGHGTGTKVGDPREAKAIAAVYGASGMPESGGESHGMMPHRTEPLSLGSVKSNVGHAQSAAGALSIVKVILAGLYATVPPSLHAEALSPDVDWDAAGIRVPAEAAPWRGVEGRRLGAVSSFGVAGTNAHLIMEIPQEATHDTVGANQ